MYLCACVVNERDATQTNPRAVLHTLIVLQVEPTLREMIFIDVNGGRDLVVYIRVNI